MSFEFFSSVAKRTINIGRTSIGGVNSSQLHGLRGNTLDVRCNRYTLLSESILCGLRLVFAEGLDPGHGGQSNDHGAQDEK